MWHDGKIVSTFTMTLKDQIKIKLHLTQWDHGGFSYDIVQFNSGWLYISPKDMEEAKAVCLNDLSKQLRFVADKIDEANQTNSTHEEADVSV
jgi:hypothetical protein